MPPGLISFIIRETPPRCPGNVSPTQRAKGLPGRNLGTIRYAARIYLPVANA